MCDTSIKRGIGAAAFKASRPKPALIGKKHADTAFADTIKHQKRFSISSAHHGFAFWRADINCSEPAAPMGRLLRASIETAGYGMAFAKLGQARIERFLYHLACRHRR